MVEKSVSWPEFELVTRHVAGLVLVPVPRTKKLAIWTVPQARLFLESARRDDDDPLYAGYILMLILGLRRDELLGLGWDDIKLESGEAHIAWQLQRIKGELRRRPTKTLTSEAHCRQKRRCRSRTSAPELSLSAR